MERSAIRDRREASMPPRISLRSIRVTLALTTLRSLSVVSCLSVTRSSPQSHGSPFAACRVFLLCDQDGGECGFHVALIVPIVKPTLSIVRKLFCLGRFQFSPVQTQEAGKCHPIENGCVFK